MRTITLSLALCLACVPVFGGSALAKTSAPRQDAQYQDQPGGYDYETYTPQQLDNLLAPIALYPDPLLAQVLIAATFPDQLQDASDWVRRYGPSNPGLDNQPWDVSVRAVAHYPAVLYMMNDKIDWTTAVGQAYVNQSTDTIASIQNLRGLARSEGNLFSTPQQQVVDSGGYIQILPAEPQYIFVPTYDPGAIYSRRVYNGSSFGGFFSFGSGFAIGAWLNYDLDWGSRRVVYNNWQGGGWRQRSRPFVQVNNNVYINNRYQNVIVNRTVVNRPVDVQKVNQFNSVHSNVKFGDRPRGNGQPGGRPGPGGNPNAGGNPNNNNSNDANRNPRTVQPSQPQQRPADSFNRGGQGQGQPAPAAPQQQPPQVLRQNNQNNNNNDANANRPGIRGGGQNPGGQNGAPGNEIRVRGQGQQQTPPPATPQQTPPAQQRNFPQQNNNGNNNGNRGQQNQAPPARVEPARPIPPAAQPPPAAPAQRPPQPVQQQRPVQEQRQQAAPAPPPQQQRPAQEQRQAAPAQQGGQAKGQQDRGGNKGQDNKDNKKGGNDRPN